MDAGLAILLSAVAGSSFVIVLWASKFKSTQAQEDVKATLLL